MSEPELTLQNYKSLMQRLFACNPVAKTAIIGPQTARGMVGMFTPDRPLKVAGNARQRRTIRRMRANAWEKVKQLATYAKDDPIYPHDSLMGAIQNFTP